MSSWQVKRSARQVPEGFGESKRKKQTNGLGDQLFLVSWLSICNYTLYQLKLLHALHVGWMRPVDHLGAAGAPQSAQLINPG